MRDLIDKALRTVAEYNERTEEAHSGAAPFAVVASDFAVGILFHDLTVWTDEDCEYEESSGDMGPIDRVLVERLTELRNELTAAIDDKGPEAALGALEGESFWSSTRRVKED